MASTAESASLRVLTTRPTTSTNVALFTFASHYWDRYGTSGDHGVCRWSSIPAIPSEFAASSNRGSIFWDLFLYRGSHRPLGSSDILLLTFVKVRRRTARLSSLRRPWSFRKEPAPEIFLARSSRLRGGSGNVGRDM